MGNPVNLAEGMCVGTSKDVGWMDDSRLKAGLVRDAQERDAVIGLFLQFRKKGDKPEWNDISAQGAEFKSYWPQWESLVIDEEWLLCRKIPKKAGCT